MAAGDSFAYLPPEKRYPFCSDLAAKSAQKKNPLAEVKSFYHIRADLSSVFGIFFENFSKLFQKIGKAAKMVMRSVLYTGNTVPPCKGYTAGTYYFFFRLRRIATKSAIMAPSKTKEDMMNPSNGKTVIKNV